MYSDPGQPVDVNVKTPTKTVIQPHRPRCQDSGFKLLPPRLALMAGVLQELLIEVVRFEEVATDSRNLGLFFPGALEADADQQRKHGCAK